MGGEGRGRGFCRAIDSSYSVYVHVSSGRRSIDSSPAVLLALADAEATYECFEGKLKYTGTLLFRAIHTSYTYMHRVTLAVLVSQESLPAMYHCCRVCRFALCLLPFLFRSCPGER